ncbi:MAG: PAS domain-containing protein [Blastocatellia bacterium]
MSKEELLDNELRIRRFTPKAERELNLVATDIGRPITDLNLNLNLPALPKLLMEAIDTVSAREFEARDQQGRWHSLRIQPYKTLENRIDGAVMVRVDIDQLKRIQEKLRLQNRLIESSFEPIPIAAQRTRGAARGAGRVDGRVASDDQRWARSDCREPPPTERVWRAAAGAGDQP